MRCNCGQTNMICPVHPPLGAPTNSLKMSDDFDDSMELISSKELTELRAKLAEQEDANRKLLHEVMQLSAERVSLKNELAALRERERSKKNEIMLDNNLALG
jgi:predicted RNase H-like nuclease (RuvC/YqgF family)